MHFERIFLSKKDKVSVILKYFYKMRLRIYNYNKISHSNKLQRLNEARLYTFLFITCSLLRFSSTRLYTNIKVSNYNQQSYVVVTCIKMLIYNNRSHKLFVNISRLYKHTSINKHSWHDYTMCSSSYFFHSQKIYIQIEYCVQESPIPA